MKRSKIALPLLLVGAWVEIAEAKANERKSIYPGKNWEVGRPEQVGLDARMLKALSDYNMAIFFDCLFGKVYKSTWKTSEILRNIKCPKCQFSKQATRIQQHRPFASWQFQFS